MIFQNYSVKPELICFNLRDIKRVYFALNGYDYREVLRDLYERFCIFGTISNYPKNHFITEMEQKLNIEANSIIVLYNSYDKVRRYYYVLSIEDGFYKCLQVTNHKGQIAIKDEQVKEIPTTTYIMEKIPTTAENRERLFR